MKALSTLIGGAPVQSKQDVCEKHGEFTNKKYVIGNNERWSGCPKCALEQAQKISMDFNEMDKKARDDVKQKKQSEMDASLGMNELPKRFIDWQFQDLKIVDPKQLIIFDRCVNYIDDFENNKDTGKNMIFCGGIGTGKTQLAVIIARELISRGYSVGVFEMCTLLDTVNHSYSITREYSENKIIREYAEKDLLIMDEAKKEHGSDTEIKIVMNLLNERYKRELPTIITTNLTPPQLEQCLSERAMDRLRENGECFVFTWKSFRRKE